MEGSLNCFIVSTLDLISLIFFSNESNDSPTLIPCHLWFALIYSFKPSELRLKVKSPSFPLASKGLPLPMVGTDDFLAWRFLVVEVLLIPIT